MLLSLAMPTIKPFLPRSDAIPSLLEPLKETLSGSIMPSVFMLPFWLWSSGSPPARRRGWSGRIRPLPVPDLRHILPVLEHIARMLDEGVAKLLFDVSRGDAKAGHPLDHLDRQMKPVELVQHDHVEGRGGGTLFLETTNMHSGMVGPAIGQAMDQVGIAVIGEDHRLVAGEHPIKVAVAEAMRMLFFRLQRHQVDDVNDTNPQVG